MYNSKSTQVFVVFLSVILFTNRFHAKILTYFVTFGTLLCADKILYHCIDWLIVLRYFNQSLELGNSLASQTKSLCGPKPLAGGQSFQRNRSPQMNKRNMFFGSGLLFRKSCPQIFRCWCDQYRKGQNPVARKVGFGSATHDDTSLVVLAAEEKSRLSLPQKPC